MGNMKNKIARQGQIVGGMFKFRPVDGRVLNMRSQQAIIQKAGGRIILLQHSNHLNALPCRVQVQWEQRR